jgi:hypothetical protein
MSHSKVHKKIFPYLMINIEINKRLNKTNRAQKVIIRVAKVSILMTTQNYFIWENFIILNHFILTKQDLGKVVYYT